MMLKKTALLVCTLICVFSFGTQAMAQTTTFPSGSAIIDMGSATPTTKNSLKPYGLVYALLKNNHVPVNVVANNSKVQDGIDFSYNGKSYKGGTFVISGDYITPAVTAVITSWVNQGVVVDYSNSTFSVTVTNTYKFVPHWVMDRTNGSIAVGFLTAAGIPSSAYNFKLPSELGDCQDLFVLPHADPVWSTHSKLLEWNRDNKGAIWAGCHAVSVLENLFDPGSPSTKMNFLSTNGLVAFTDHAPNATPFSNLLPGDPVAQYLGKTDNAQQGGSETVYLPKVGSAWRPTTKILTSSPGQVDLPSLDAGTVAAENLYGPGFGDATRGLVAYQASHNIGGFAADNIAAQRVFFNFSLLALNTKVPPIIAISLNGIASTYAGGSSVMLTPALTFSGSGSLSYKWSVSDPALGSFVDATSPTPTFNPSSVGSLSTAIISVVITQSGCERVAFDAKKITITPPVAGNPLKSARILLNIPDGCTNPILTFNVLTENPDAAAGTRTLVNVDITGVAASNVITDVAGNVRLTAPTDFKGILTGTYTVTNVLQTSPAGVISITVGGDAVNLAPVVASHALTPLTDNVTDIDVLATDQNNNSDPLHTLLSIRSVTQPTNGYVYINAIGTLSYLSKKEQATGGADNFTYTVCNTAGYCTIGTVNVTVIADNCAVGSYQITTTGTAASMIFSATDDTYIRSDQTGIFYNTQKAMQVNNTSNPKITSLLKFDVSALPANINITSSVISLNVSSTATGSGFTVTGATNNIFPITIYSILKTWSESSVNWSQSSPGNAWTGANAAGTDYTNRAANPTFTYGNAPYPAGTLLSSSDLSVIVKEWYADGTTNKGLLLVPNSHSLNVNAGFITGNQSTATMPRIKVNYTIPVCSVIPDTYAPVAIPDVATTDAKSAVLIDVKANDLNYYNRGNTVTAVTQGSNGATVTIDGGTNKVLYTPGGSFNGVDEITYTIKDNINNVTFTSKIRVTVVRASPIIQSDVATVTSSVTSQATSTTTDVGANDNDPQGGTIDAPVIITQPKNGSVVIVTGNIIKYTPAQNFVGTDTYTYRRAGTAPDVCSVALSGLATVTVTVTNRDPVANPTSINTFACVPATIKVLDIASDPEGGALSATITSGPTSGSVVAKSDGTFVYTPNTSYNGPDAFSYTVTDPLTAVSTAATVSITVSGAVNANTSPIAVADADITQMEQAVYTNVKQNDSDPNNDVITVSLGGGLALPISGTIQLMNNQLIKYTPNSGFVGTDTYQYRLSDTHPGCAGNTSLQSVTTVTITVKATPTTLSGTVWDDVDVSGTSSFANIKTLTETGTSGNGGVFVYLVDANDIIIDKTPVDVDGTYLLSSVPSGTSGLKLLMSSEDVLLGAALTAGSVPNGYNNSTPVTRNLPTITTGPMSPYDWGIFNNPTLTPGTIIAPANVCSATATPGTLSSTANATGGSVTATGYVYQWQSSITSISTGFADIAGATSASYTPAGPLTTTTYFKRRVSTNMDAAKFSNVVTIIYTANPTVVITPAVATIGVGGNIGLTASGADSYVWTPATGLSGTVTAAVTATPVSTTFYTVTGTLTPSGCSATASITVTVINAGTIGADQTNCGPFTPGTLTSISDASGTTGITYTWEASVTSASTGFSTIAGATATTYTPAGAITLTTYYKRVATGGGQSYRSNVVIATVNTVPAVAVTPTAVTILSGLTATLTASGADSYAWTPATGLSSAATAVVIAAPVSTTTYIITGTATPSGCVATATVTVTVIHPGTIGADQNGCGPFTPATINSVADASGAVITYQWQSSTTDATSGFSNIGAATASTYTAAAPVSATTYYRRIATGGGQSYNSNVITVTVKSLPSVSVLPTSVALAAGLSATLTASGADNYSWAPTTDLSSSNTAAVITTPTASVVYVVTGTVTATGCSASASVTVTVTNAGMISADQANCGTYTPAGFTSVADGIGAGITYQWQSSTTSTTAGFTNIGAATATTYTPGGAITQTTYYRRVATSGGNSYNSNVVTAVVNTIPTVSITPTSAVIALGMTQTLTASGANTYSWSPAGTLSANNGASVIATPTVSITYNVTGTVTATGCNSGASVIVTVINPGMVAGDQANCGAFTPVAFTSTTDASGTGGITYQWQSSTTSATTGFANIGGATASTYAPSLASATTYYRRIATGAGRSFSSNTITVVINPKPVTGITPTSAVIGLGMTQTLTANGSNTYAWAPTASLSASNGATVIATPAVTTMYTVTGTLTVTGCTNTAMVTVTVIDPGVIAGDQANCGAFTPTSFTSTANASGAAGISYQWQSSTTNTTTGFANIADATFATYAPPMRTVTTYYRRVATFAGNSYNSNVITTTVNSAAVVAIAPTAATITVGLTQTFTASGANTYVWTPATYLSATNTAVVIATPSATGTTVYTVTGTITASGCSATASVTLNVVALGSLLPGTIGSPQTICASTAPIAFTSTAATGGTGTINYQWQRSLDNVTFSNIPAATSANYGAGTLTQTYYYRRAASTSTDAAVFTPSVKVNVLQRPSIVGGINGVCAMPKDSIKTFSVTPAALATSYVWTIPVTPGWSGSSTTNTINVKAGNTNGTITVTPYNLGCAGSQITYNIAIIDYAQVTITGTPVSASGTSNDPINVKIQLFDVLGNIIGCSGGPATLCSTGGTFTKVTDNGDGTYTSQLISTADNVTICGSVAGVPISKTTTVTFTGPQGGIKSNGPIFDFEIPKITFTATEGRAPFTVIYHSDKAAAGKNDTLRNVTSGTAYAVAKIPSTTLYKLVEVIDANNERRDRNFVRDTTTTRVVASKVIITLKADPAKREADSTWATRIVVHTKNIGDLDLTNSQARLNLKDVFPSPVTYVLDSVKVTGGTVRQNMNYDGIINNDLFAKLTKKKTYNAPIDLTGMAPDASSKDELWNNEEDETVVRIGDDGHSIYMFGPQSNLPVGMDATIILWLHVKPNGYTEPFVMQAVALGTGHTEGATSLTTSLSNDNDQVAEHPEVTKKGDPLPAIINLFPTASVGVSLEAGAPVSQGNGTYNVLLTYKLKNYGNVNLRNVTLTQNLLRSILSPSTFNIVGGVTATGGLIVNPTFNAKLDSNMLAADNILGYKQESTLSYTINITPNQLASIYRLQALASGYSDDLAKTVTDLSTDGNNPDPDDNNIPSEKVITTIIINTPVPPLVPGNIGINTGSTTVLANGYCGSSKNVEIIPTSVNTGGLDAYLYQWQSSPDNVTFKDVIGAESANYIIDSVGTSYYLRRGTISGSQIKFSNSVYIQIYPVPATPVITGTGTMVVGKGNITLTSPLATGYVWSTGATTRSITVTDPGSYTVTVRDAQGCTATATAYAITSLDPGKAADIQKILSSAPTLQQDGSFLVSFNIIATNLRAELLDSVKIVDDLTKVFPTQSTFTVIDIKASGGLIANPSYDGKTNIHMLSDVSKLSSLKKDSVQVTLKVFPNGFAGTLNNIATLTANSPLGKVSVSSNDPLSNTDPAVRAPTKFVIPIVDISIPTAFSPNHDGINDRFVITRPFNTTIKMEIYNRWSNLVYKSLDYKNEWDGKGNQANRVLGEDLPDGTYYFEVLAVNQTTGAVRKFAGYITLKR